MKEMISWKNLLLKSILTDGGFFCDCTITIIIIIIIWSNKQLFMLNYTVMTN